MFVSFWLIFLGTGLLMAALTVVWGIRNHQFEDQDRARYLPLADLTAEDYATPPAPGARARGWLVTGVMMLTGVLVLGATVLYMTRVM